MKGPVSGRLRKRTEPTAGEIEVLRLVGGGLTVSQAAAKLNISPFTARDRFRRLKFLAQRNTIPALVYWGLRQRHFEYNYGKNTQPISPIQVQIISRLALDQSEKTICKKMGLLPSQVQGQLRLARRATGAKSRSES